MSALRTTMRVLPWVVVAPLVVLLTVLGALFLHFSNLPWGWARTGLAVAFFASVPGLFIFLKPRWKALLAFAGSFGLLLLWYRMIPASNARHCGESHPDSRCQRATIMLSC